MCARPGTYLKSKFIDYKKQVNKEKVFNFYEEITDHSLFKHIVENNESELFKVLQVTTNSSGHTISLKWLKREKNYFLEKYFEINRNLPNYAWWCNVQYGYEVLDLLEVPVANFRVIEQL